MTTGFLERIRSQMTLPSTSWQGRARLPRSKQRHAVVANRWDLEAWRERRSALPIDDLIEDLIAGDGGDRPGFEEAASLVEGTFFLFYKADPQIVAKRELARELYPVRAILEEVRRHPTLEEVREHTYTEAEYSVLATEAMGDFLREILSRLPEPVPSPSGSGGSQGEPGSGGGGGGEPDPSGSSGAGGQGQGQGEQEEDEDGGGQGGGDQQQDGDQEDDSQGRQGGGQGDQEGDQEDGEGSGGSGQPSDEEGDEEGENGPPPPPKEREAPQGDDLQDEDLAEGEQEFDPDAVDDEAESEWEAQYDAALAGMDLERLVGQALQSTLKSTRDLDGLMKDIGIDDGMWATMDPSQRLALADALRTPEMQALAAIIGRMKRFAMGVKQTRIVDVPHEAYDVTLGNNIKHVLASEFVYLALEETSWEFYRRYVNGELMQFKLRGTEEAGKGPIVCMVDKSYSMNGDPFRWAIAVCEALRRFAAEERRDMYVLIFGTNGQRQRYWFPQGMGPIEMILTMLGTVADGGTEFDGVLAEGLHRATTAFENEGKDRADMVFITDGNARLSKEWIAEFNAERERADVHVYSVYIGGATDMRYQTGPVALLNQISDAVIPVHELEPSAVRDIFSKV